MEPCPKCSDTGIIKGVEHVFFGGAASTRSSDKVCDCPAGQQWRIDHDAVR